MNDYIEEAYEGLSDANSALDSARDEAQDEATKEKIGSLQTRIDALQMEVDDLKQ